MSRPATRYRFVPARPCPLERRDLPSTLPGAPAELRNLRATITGPARLSSPDKSGPGDHQVDFTGGGRDAKGRPVSIEGGSIITYDPSAGVDLPGTYGGGILKTRRGLYNIALSGPPSDLSGPDGVSNLQVTITSVARSPRGRVGHPAAIRTFAFGTLQVHHMPTGDGGEQVTASLLV